MNGDEDAQLDASGRDVAQPSPSRRRPPRAGQPRRSGGHRTASRHHRHERRGEGRGRRSSVAGGCASMVLALQRPRSWWEDGKGARRDSHAPSHRRPDGLRMAIGALRALTTAVWLRTVPISGSRPGASPDRSEPGSVAPQPPTGCRLTPEPTDVPLASGASGRAVGPFALDKLSWRPPCIPERGTIRTGRSRGGEGREASNARWTAPAILSRWRRPRLAAVTVTQAASTTVSTRPVGTRDAALANGQPERAKNSRI